MPKHIPISAAKEMGKKFGLSQIIITAWDGERTHVITYGVTLMDCEQAAIGGNKIKRALGWPEEDCKAVPRRLGGKGK